MHVVHLGGAATDDRHPNTAYIVHMQGSTPFITERRHVKEGTDAESGLADRCAHACAQPKRRGNCLRKKTNAMPAAAAAC